jgi:pyruvate/2-oxoglutarate dehydrogenase complex dihydrolipoamide dehydrogenase (E3) component
MFNFDAIIIGTGQSGPALAQRLVAAGWKVRLPNASCNQLGHLGRCYLRIERVGPAYDFGYIDLLV